MTALAIPAATTIADNDNVVASLPAMVRRAASQLEGATTAAEVLEAKATAGLAYDAAKAAARFAKAKGAYDDVIGAVYRAQADALEIEAMAKRRLADEVDRAQRNEELASPKTTWKTKGWSDATGLGLDVSEALPSLRDVGIDKNDLQSGRFLSRSEDAAPGIIRSSLDAIVEGGDEPSKANLAREIRTRLNSFSGDNEWYTPARYIDMAREVMGAIDTDPASNPTAQRTVGAATYYTVDDNGLDKDWHGRVWMNPPYSNPDVQQFSEKVIAEYQSGRVTEAIVLTNNSADTGWHRALQDACARMCTTTGRIRFESPTRRGNSPAMGQSFFYFGDKPEKFKEVFSAIGNVWRLA